jgi:hypothetical protein
MHRRISLIKKHLARNNWIVGIAQILFRAMLVTAQPTRAVKFSFTWRIFNVFRLSEMNYAEKRPVIPTNCYFQLQSRREFGFM